jgi:CheY-like chemotaxis protein
VLADCIVEEAATHDEAVRKLAGDRFDLIVLDIMGVRGDDLLERYASAAPCIMLTAAALSPEMLERCRSRRAVLYVPKEELPRLDEYAAKALLIRSLAPLPAARPGTAASPSPEIEAAADQLWPWLFRRLDFRRWFGAGWTPRPPAAD